MIAVVAWWTFLVFTMTEPSSDAPPSVSVRAEAGTLGCAGQGCGITTNDITCAGVDFRCVEDTGHSQEK